ncbi:MULTISPECIES: DUF3558 domain-containing protein [unclassified Crossiella]|uniref:DUF3558 domain-containing protein n=1 Tax=unclassified Crossiella TaxID=2620835 RepID=UPI001FFF2D59|nr:MULTISPECIES: DUF3558 domain-containing protein [unclassified Crossiella]MCK2245250.1 DUF3558 domain-containing protein [Crossiella sp. S99.2]MCK2258903.1 DUF3558 domain-containing protein [Crossiella sp. S99.1]
MITAFDHRAAFGDHATVLSTGLRQRAGSPTPPTTAARPMRWRPALTLSLWMLGLCTMLLLTGCAAPQQLATTTPAPNAVLSSANKQGAPPLTQPELDVRPFADDRCALLTSSQLTQLGIAVAGQPGDSPLGKRCRWNATDTPAKVDFFLNVNTQLGGLDQLYRLKSGFQWWEPLTISGYPAVIHDDIWLPGGCQINVGVSPTVLLRVGLSVKSGAEQAHDYNAPCPRGVAILEQAILTLKGGR